MTITGLARPEIRALEPYKAAEQLDNTIRLNANELPWSSREDRFRRPLNRYPEIRPAKLRNLLAENFGCEPASLIVTRGSSEGIDLLVRVFCRAGQDSIATTTPTFLLYRHYAEVQGARLIEFLTTRDQDFAVDIDALIAECDESTRLIFLCSPNNPTGNVIPRHDLLSLLESRTNKSVVVIDEAYIEFAQQPSIVELLDQYENLVVLRTLSKARAYAGARCGCVIAAPAVIRMLDAVQAPYALATPVIECVENAMLADSADADGWIEDVITERAKLIDAIREFPFVRRVWPSSANFFLIEVENVAALLEQTAGDGILLRDFAGDLANCIRITVGSETENNRLLQSLRRLRDS
jgi:histidinol-phosphate aminotransferase